MKKKKRDFKEEKQKQYREARKGSVYDYCSQNNGTLR